MRKKKNTIHPVIPLRDIIIFPGMLAPLFVGRDKSIKALEASKSGQGIVLVTQKDAGLDEINPDDIYQVGVFGNILQLLKMPDGTVKLLVEATSRVKVRNFKADGEYFTSEIDWLSEVYGDPLETEVLTNSVVRQTEQYLLLNKKISADLINIINEIKDPGKMADVVCTHLPLKIKDKQELLETLDVTKRLERLYGILSIEIELLNTEDKIRNRVKQQLEKTQKEYYLNEQIKAIQHELGDGDDGRNEVNALEKQINELKLSKEAKEKALSELKRFKSMNPMSAEAAIIRNYLDWLLSLPWGKHNKLKNDIKHAKVVLDNDHYGLEKVKERILEYLAVQQRTKKIKGPILCLVGPPGVGKTSLAKSIADAIGREFVKFALGGVRDEAEIRGHRRTYIGAMPGKIIQMLKKSKSSNPIFLLDEIDKLGVDFRGDPASALLEVLDPEQNSKFADHYLEVEYDLSEVMFVATANSLNIPRALLDRMEIIRLSGYTEEEKLEIANRHLIPKITKEHGLKKGELVIEDGVINEIIRHYTREAGVRSLEREIAKLARKAVKEILETKNKYVSVNKENLSNYAGVQRYNYNDASSENQVGVTTGLAYTEFGGDLLSIEAVNIPGKGNIKTTGKLGDVMQESAQAAFSYFRSRCCDLGVKPGYYQKRDVHIHVPEGATPKDGPSAGIAMYTSIVSVMTNIPVRSSVAMTGEITLRGRVLAIGGLKEKLLSALRGGIKTVIIPQENVKDLVEMPENVKNGLEIIPVNYADDVLKIALVSAVNPIPWDEIDSTDRISHQKDTNDVITH
jgi:ATP-dependent Lon protease